MLRKFLIAATVGAAVLAPIVSVSSAGASNMPNGPTQKAHLSPNAGTGIVRLSEDGRYLTKGTAPVKRVLTPGLQYQVLLIESNGATDGNGHLMETDQQPVCVITKVSNKGNGTCSHKGSPSGITVGMTVIGMKVVVKDTDWTAAGVASGPLTAK